LGARVIEKNISGGEREILSGEEEFFTSILGRSRHELFLIEDGGEVMVMTRGKSLSRDLLDTVRRDINFYWNHRETILNKAENRYGV
jgi:hypothetical protein